MRFVVAFKKSCAMLAPIPSDLEAFVLAEVVSGKYASADEAVLEAVRRFEERECYTSRGQNEILASRMPSGCGFLIAAGNPWPDGTRLA